MVFPGFFFGLLYSIYCLLILQLFRPFQIYVGNWLSSKTHTFCKVFSGSFPVLQLLPEVNIPFFKKPFMVIVLAVKLIWSKFIHL